MKKQTDENTAKTEQRDEAVGAPETPNRNEEPAQEKPKTKKQLFLQLIIFTAFMASAGVIQFVTTGLLSTWTGLMSEDSDYYWIAYLVGLILSVIWSFTFNRKFTFKAASNLPLAMGLVALYYCAFAPLSTFGANAIVKAWQTAAGEGWDQNYEMVITVGMMLINFVTEYFWEKFVVFNDAVMAKIERKLHIKRKDTLAEQEIDTEETVKEELAETTAPEQAEETPIKQTDPPEQNEKYDE